MLLLNCHVRLHYRSYNKWVLLNCILCRDSITTFLALFITVWIRFHSFITFLRTILRVWEVKLNKEKNTTTYFINVWANWKWQPLPHFTMKQVNKLTRNFIKHTKKKITNITGCLPIFGTVTRIQNKKQNTMSTSVKKKYVY